MDEPQTLRTLGSSSTLRVPTFGVPARAGAGATDLTGELQRARRELDAGRQAEQTPVLRVFEDSEVPLSLEYASYEDGLIEDAKANIAAGNIELALAQLHEVLELVPGHHEARYLRSYCLLSSGHEMAALTELESLRADRPEPELAERVLQLRVTLRGKLTGRLLADQDEDALAEYLRLVPEEGRCWVGLTVQRAQRGDLQGAVAAAQAGARAADTEADRRILGRLTYQLRLHLLRALTSSLTAMLLEGAYDPALAELRRLGPDWNSFEPVTDLAAYIIQLSREGPGGRPCPGFAPTWFTTCWSGATSHGPALCSTRGGRSRAWPSRGAVSGWRPPTRSLTSCWASACWSPGATWMRSRRPLASLLPTSGSSAQATCWTPSPCGGWTERRRPSATSSATSITARPLGSSRPGGARRHFARTPRGCCGPSATPSGTQISGRPAASGVKCLTSW